MISNLETWIYTGARVSGDGQRLTSWRDQSGGTILYEEETISYVVGGVYAVRAERNDHQVLRGTPSLMKRHDDPDEIAAWEVLNHRAEIRLARQLREAHGDRTPDFSP